MGQDDTDSTGPRPEVPRPDPERRLHPPRPPRRRRPFPWRVLGSVLVLPVLALLVLPLFLIGQEIAAPSWVARSLEAQAEGALGGGRLRFGSIDLSLGPDLHPSVRLTDARLFDAEGHLVLRVPETRVGLSPRGLVLRGEALPQTLELTGAEARLERDAEGRFALAFEGGGGAGLDLTPRGLSALFERPGLEAVDEVRIEGLVMSYRDGRSGRSWTLDGGRAVLDRRAGMRISAEAAVLTGRAYPTTLALEAVAADGGLELAVSVVDAPARDLAGQIAPLAWLAALDAPLSLEIETGFAADGAPQETAARLSLRDGALAVGSAPVAIPEARAELTLDPATGHVRFDGLSVVTDRGRLSGRGATFPDAQGRLVGQFALTGIELAAGTIWEAPRRFPAAWIDLRLGLSPFRLELGQVTLDGDDGTRLSGRGDIARENGGWTVSADLRLPEVDMAGLARLWPDGVRPGVRDWTLANIPEARFTRGALALRFAPDGPPVAAWTQSFEAATIRTFGGLPPLTGAAGRITLEDGRFTVALEEGRMEAAEGGTVDAAGSVLVLPRVGAAGGPVELDLAAEGTVTAMLSLLDQPPFTLMTNAGRPVDLARGRASLEARLRWPLVRPVPPGALRWEVAGALTGVDSETLIPGRRLEATLLQLEASNELLEIAGPMRLAGVPLQASWRRPLGPGSAGQTTVTGEMALSRANLAALGVTLPEGLVGGEGRAGFTLAFPDGAPPRLAVSSDLEGIALSLPQLGWRLPEAGTGRLEVEAELGAAPQVTRLAVEAPGLAAEGRVRLQDGAFAALEIDRLRTGGWLDISGRLVSRGPGRAPEVIVSGGTLDLRAARFGGGGGGGGGDGPIEVALDRVQVTEGIGLTGFRASLTTGGGLSGRFLAALNGGTAVQGTLVPAESGTAIRLQSGDAGGAMRDARLFPGATGGTLDLTLTPVPGPGRFDGRLAMGPLRVRDVPSLAALLDAVSVVGLLQQLDGQGLAFDTVEAEFALAPDRVTIRRAAAVGPGLGISLDGYLTPSTGALDLQGVLSPFYFLNQIGSVLTRAGEGLVGISFTLQGTLAEPRVGANPLSLLTPGMFREIFRRPPPGP